MLLMQQVADQSAVISISVSVMRSHSIEAAGAAADQTLCDGTAPKFREATVTTRRRVSPIGRQLRQMIRLPGDIKAMIASAAQPGQQLPSGPGDHHLCLVVATTNYLVVDQPASRAVLIDELPTHYAVRRPETGRKPADGPVQKAVDELARPVRRAVVTAEVSMMYLDLAPPCVDTLTDGAAKSQSNGFEIPGVVRKCRPLMVQRVDRSPQAVDDFRRTGSDARRDLLFAALLTTGILLDRFATERTSDHSHLCISVACEMHCDMGPRPPRQQRRSPQRRFVQRRNRRHHTRAGLPDHLKIFRNRGHANISITPTDFSEPRAKNTAKLREACLRCSMHWPDPAQRDRIAEIRDNLIARIAEAERKGWLGEIEGLQTTLAGAEDKLAQIDHRAHTTIDLGMPVLTPTPDRKAFDGAIEAKSMTLMPGQRVQAKVVSHHPWGVLVEIAGYEDAELSASIDMIQQFSPTTNGNEDLLARFPPIGAEIDAVIEQIHLWHPPVSVRLSIRPADLESLDWPCDFCGEPTTLSPGGATLVLDVRSNDGPGSHTVISHRHCLAERIRPENTGERARALKIGTM